MTRKTITTKLARRVGLLAAFAILAAAMIAPASGFASAPVKFGSLLNPTIQPSNSLPGITCNAEATAGSACTMVQDEAYGRPNGGELAPKTGTIKRIRIIAGGPGSFRLMAVKHINGTESIAKRY